VQFRARERDLSSSAKNYQVLIILRVLCLVFIFSLWTVLNHNSNIQKFKNPLYVQTDLIEFLNPTTSANQIVCCFFNSLDFSIDSIAILVNIIRQK
jgi:hypothetical protein